MRLDVRPPDPTPPETLTEAQVKAVIGANFGGVTACYERQLAAGEALPGGKVLLRFEIRPAGRTSGVSLDRDFASSAFAACVRGVVQQWRFPSFTGAPIPVEYPLILEAPK
ncbi:MAG: AgmX/PglI C-terminal domain-containing protein [bacterium]